MSAIPPTKHSRSLNLSSKVLLGKGLDLLCWQIGVVITLFLT